MNLPKDLLAIDSTTITVGKNHIKWAKFKGEKLANPECILVEDRAYAKLARFDEFNESKQWFVIRIKENITTHSFNL
ncbi:hypothetical protein [Tepidibacter formicigenes]|uniref:hypothetical protein n=1 Tax=Tepidibacter formicigenes TaxID=227138 RepID=UPI001160DD01|nr:hypothetical protein [Tepidibacter formicigenes]